MALRREYEYECPSCHSLHDNPEQAEKCRKSHPILKRETIYCECGMGFYVWRWGSEQVALAAIRYHVNRNHDIVEKRGADDANA